MIQRLSSSEAMDISLSKQRTAIGSLNTDLFFSVSTARQINKRIAVRDTWDRSIINLLLCRQPQLQDGFASLPDIIAQIYTKSAPCGN
jgi:hypothetical protein